MDLIDLRLFLHVVAQGSITAGAERSHMTLASASARVGALEGALGTPLLVRDRRGAQPTPAGQTLARHAQQVLAQVGQLHEAMAEHTEGPRAHLRVLAHTSAATVHLPPLLARFLAAHPGYTLDMQERPSAAIADALRQRPAARALDRRLGRAQLAARRAIVRRLAACDGQAGEIPDRRDQRCGRA